MPIQVTMPRLSDTMEQGAVVKWHVNEGDTVSSGDVLADIETDKATMELESFDDGVVASLVAQEGQTVKVGDLIVVIAEDGESVEDAKSAASGSASSGASASAEQADGGSETSAPAATAVAETPANTDAPTSHGAASHGATSNGSGTDGGSASGGRIFASPLARKLAADANLDLGQLTGTGPSGRIVRKDVEAAIAGGGPSLRAGSSSQTHQATAQESRAPAPLPAPGAALESTSVKLSNMRGVIARRLVESKTTVPHYQVTLEVDMDPILDLRKQLNEQLASQGVKLSVNDFLIRACGLAMHQHPHVNSSWNPSGPSIDLHGQVNVGMAIALPEERGGGLVVATIRDADRVGLRQISAESKRLATKARDKGLTVEEMADSTFAISNLGMFGVSHFTAIINPPNAAILAVGAAEQKPVVRNGEIVIGHVMSMTMSSDHRIIDGAMAAQFLQTVKQLLEAPATLLV